MQRWWWSSRARFWERRWRRSPFSSAQTRRASKLQMLSGNSRMDTIENKGFSIFKLRISGGSGWLRKTWTLSRLEKKLSTFPDGPFGMLPKRCLARMYMHTCCLFHLPWEYHGVVQKSHGKGCAWLVHFQTLLEFNWHVHDYTNKLICCKQSLGSVHLSAFTDSCNYEFEVPRLLWHFEVKTWKLSLEEPRCTFALRYGSGLHHLRTHPNGTTSKVTVLCVDATASQNKGKTGGNCLSKQDTLIQEKVPSDEKL